MSYSKKEFVIAALTELGIADYEYDIEPGELQQGAQRLDAMVADWNAKGVRLPYPLPGSPADTDPTEKTNVPDHANETIITNLAVRLGPSYGKEVARDTKAIAKRAYESLLRLAAIPGTRQFPQTMPMGQGNKTWRYDGDPYFNAPVPNLGTGQGDNLDLPGLPV